MTSILIEKKQKLAESKKRIEAKEKLLREKERKLKTKEHINRGVLIEKSGLENLNNTTLLGALLEIKELSQDQSRISKWEKKGEEFQNRSLNNEQTPLIVSIENNDEKEAVMILRDLKFKWNAFRKEWYGYGVKSDIEKALEPFKANIESVA
jgi:hypothetical protein